MKTAAALIVLLLLTSAHASYYATHCSSASGSVSWESGHNSNTIKLKYWDQTEMIKTLPLEQVDIKVKETHLISEQRSSGCMSSFKRVYVAEATIVASPDFPTSLDFLQYPGPLKSQVLCEYNMNSRGPGPCP